MRERHCRPARAEGGIHSLFPRLYALFLPMAGPLLELENVTALRAGKRALDRVSLRIRAGENVAIVGPNGSGKSTLVKLLTRELYPVALEGPFTLRVLGRERWELLDLRRHLGIVSPDLQTDFTREITGLDAVVSGFFGSVGTWLNTRVTTAQIREAERALDRLGIAHLAERPMTEMSSGEGRRVLIARALVHRPDALLLDEPMNSLDLRAHREVRDAMRRLARGGTSILLVTHALEDVVPEIARAVLLKNGRVFRDGPTAEILTDANLSSLFDLRLRVEHADGVWSSR